MLILDKANICQYVATHYPQFDQSQGVTVQEIGDPSQELREDESIGLVNYIFRLTNPVTSIIIKQGQETMRINEKQKLPSARNRMEYETLCIRQAITPQFIPTPYYHDAENAVFIMEDVSSLGSVRYQLCQGKMLPNLATQVGTFAAANAFYTSELYMDTDQFRRLSAHFRNSEMREIMESWVFLRNVGDPDADSQLDTHSLQLKALVENNQAVRVRTYALRHKFMSHTECFIHGDLHASNMFGNGQQLKIIDMEYTFAGPYCYDIGYFINSLLGEYCSACFRGFPDERSRATYIAYILNSIATVYHTFVAQFSAHWHKDAKEVYRNETAYLQSLIDSFLPDVLGYSAMSTLCQHHYRVTTTFTHLPPDVTCKVQELCTLLSQHLLVNGVDYPTIEEAIASLVELTTVYRAGLA